MQNREVPTIIFSKEEVFEKKRIMSFLRTNNIEFVPKNNYYDDYEATIKVRNQTVPAREEMLKILDNQEYLNKIEFLFGIVSSGCESQVETEQDLCSNNNDDKLPDSEQENQTTAKILHPEEDHLLSEQADKKCNMNASESQLQVLKELSVAMSGLLNQENIVKTSSKKQLDFKEESNSQSKIVKSSSKELESESACSNTEGKTITTNISTEKEIKELPDIPMIKIISDDNTPIKEWKAEVDIMTTKYVVDTPTLGQSNREKKEDNLERNNKVTQDENILKTEGHDKCLNSPTQKSNQLYESKGIGKINQSQKSSSSSLFTLCDGTEILREATNKKEPYTSEKKDNLEKIESSRSHKSLSTLEKLKELVMEDKLFQNLFQKIKESSTKDDAECLTMLITMLINALENSSQKSNSTLQSCPSELGIQIRDIQNNTVTRTLDSYSKENKLNDSKKSKDQKNSKTLNKTSKNVQSEKVMQKKDPIVAQNNLKNQIQKSNKSTALKKKTNCTESQENINSSHKSLQETVNSETANHNKQTDFDETGRFPQSFSCHIFRNSDDNIYELPHIHQNSPQSDHFNEQLQNIVQENYNNDKKRISDQVLANDISSIMYLEKSLDVIPKFDDEENEAENNKRIKNNEGEPKDEDKEVEGGGLDDKEIYKRNAEIMKNINNILNKTPSNSFAKMNSSKISVKSDQLASISSLSKDLSHQTLAMDLMNKKSSKALIEDEKGKIERRRFAREKYNEHSRKIFGDLIAHIEAKEGKLVTKDGQAPYENLSSEEITKYFKSLLTKKKALNAMQSRKKPKGEDNLLLC